MRWSPHPPSANWREKVNEIRVYTEKSWEEKRENERDRALTVKFLIPGIPESSLSYLVTWGNKSSIFLKLPWVRLLTLVLMIVMTNILYLKDSDQKPLRVSFPRLHTLGSNLCTIMSWVCSLHMKPRPVATNWAHNSCPGPSVYSRCIEGKWMAWPPDLELCSILAQFLIIALWFMFLSLAWYWQVEDLIGFLRVIYLKYLQLNRKWCSVYK